MSASATTPAPRQWSVGAIAGAVLGSIIIIIITIFWRARRSRRQRLSRRMYGNQVRGMQLQRWYGD